MSRHNALREKLYSTYRGELKKWLSDKSSFPRPAPVAESYGLTEWEGMVLRREVGLPEPTKPTTLEPEPADTGWGETYYHQPTETEPF